MQHVKNSEVKEEIAEQSTEFTGDGDMTCCVVCSERFASIKALADHVSIVHNETCATVHSQLWSEEQTHINYYDPWRPVSTPHIASSSERRKRSSAGSTVDGPALKSRHTLSLREYEILSILNDSGSDDDASEEELRDEEPDIVDFVSFRKHARQLRNRIVVDDPQDGWVVSDNNDESMNVRVECERMNEERIDENVDVVHECNDNLRGQAASDERSVSDEMNVHVECERMDEEHECNENIRERAASYESGERSATARQISTARVNTSFSWSEDFDSFTGQKETYTRVPGPSFSSHDPAKIFCKIWDREFLELVVRETNYYACEVISQLSDPDLGPGIPKYLECWTEVTVEELYRYFAVLIIMSFCDRYNIRDYWTAGLMEMQKFREIMGKDRFLLINKFLHFTRNENLETRGYHRKIQKVAPVVAHCNDKFKDLYTPSQHLSLDESLLLWKGRLSWKQCIKTKATRFGIKSFELCEAETGYLLQYCLYTEKITDQHPESLYGFQDHTAKIVLDLIEGYMDVGHLLIMDNWYNQLPLTRYLKSHRTDVLGTINRRRNHVPPAIKGLMPNVQRGTTVFRHCGDIALVAWKDVKLVTVVSTYCTPEVVSGRRAGQAILKPNTVQEYNMYMGGVDLKDQKLSMYLMERKRNQKWYMKVFRRLLNTSLLNAYIIYTKNPMYRVYSHRKFRQMVADGLLSRYPQVSSGPRRAPSTPQVLQRLRPGNHFPVYTECASETRRVKHKQLRCVRCTAQNRRVCVTLMCNLCKVALCIGKCWEEYHTLVNL